MHGFYGPSADPAKFSAPDKDKGQGGQLDVIVYMQLPLSPNLANKIQSKNESVAEMKPHWAIRFSKRGLGKTKRKQGSAEGCRETCAVCGS